MAYAPIAKLDNFTGKEDDTQVWLNDVEKTIAANRWNDAQAIQAIPYFLKDTTNSWYQSLQPSGLRQQNLGVGQPQNPNSQNYLSLLVTPENASTNNPTFAQKQPLTNNILPATITEDESLAIIFPFEFEETTVMSLFSGATFEAKPIIVMYTNAKDDDNNGKEEQEKESICGTTIDAWTDDKDHHKLMPILSWDDNPKRKQREELTWEIDDLT
ncbi:hypothetical protein G9A89_008200 [Geosiphon pyriformis]|nr:hypothetical protein G9A89_008200 [Geosiphon pyriformis]